MNINEYIHYFFTKTVLMQDIIYFTNLIFKCWDLGENKSLDN